MTNLYVKTLELEIENNNKILSRIGELVDDGVYTSSIKAARKIFSQIGELIGLDMSDIVDDDEDDPSVWEDDLEDEWDDLIGLRGG